MPTDPAQPTLMTRLAAALHGEVAATTVEAYRRAGAVAYQDLLQAEELRQRLTLAQKNLWSADPGESAQLLATWNAFVLQTLGDALIEADYGADPHTVGYLPPVTAEQAARFLGEVEPWSAQAHRAAADPHYDIGAELILPAQLPDWVEVEPCPRAHLSAMLSTTRSLRDHADAALADFDRSGIPNDKARDAARLRGLAADADSSAAYGESLAGDATGSDVVHDRVESSLKRAIERYFLVGQLLAMPRLMERTDVQLAARVAPGLPRPGQAGFDPWCLTDPATVDHWRGDRNAHRAIETLWRYDPDPAATLDVQAQINAAVASAAVTSAVDGRGRALGNYFCCPWAAIYLVRTPITVAGRRLRPGQEFTFDVSAEEIAEGGRFKRELLPGPFHPTDEIDYCDPTTGGHDD